MSDYQPVPPENFFVVLQDHGEADGGWGPANMRLTSGDVGPVIYTGESEEHHIMLRQLANHLHVATGKPTILARYSMREDLATFGVAEEEGE